MPPAKPDGMSTVERDEAEWKNPANWHGGPLGLYFSRRDSRPFVPKRGNPMAGATINFAHKSGIFMLLGILGFSVLMIVLTRGSHHATR